MTPPPLYKSERFVDLPHHLFRPQCGPIASQSKETGGGAATAGGGRESWRLQSERGGGVTVITRTDGDYPAGLKAIPDPPAVLHVQGKLPPPDVPMVAVVGTRTCTAYGLRTARALSAELAAAGVAIVSGLARGIDTAAHEGALSVNGITVAVLGGGLSKLNSRSDREMAGHIAKKGAVISEYPMDTIPRPAYFPVRNRIISGLSRAVVVVEAGAKSGALITVDAALEQGRDVFIVPGNVDSQASEGTNRLLKQGAKPALSSEDILEELGIASNFPPALIPVFEGDEGALFSLLAREPVHVEELIEKSRLGPARAVSLLSLMEIKGSVKQLPGKYFVRKR